jgi:glycosyltransferase involved in cell wall biosynthesis
MQKFPISLVIITLNEEKAIERCLRSAQFVDDIVVLDSGSKDRTREIAERLGARTFEEPWQGYAKQKIRAAALAKNDWILSLDADEALSPELRSEIFVEISKPDFLNQTNVDAYRMPRKTWHLGRWLRYGGTYPDYQTRLYHRGRAHWRDTQVHEKVEAKHVLSFQHPILHWSFDGVTDQIATINKYSNLRAADFHQTGKRFSCLKMIFKTLSKFFECYILKQGFRDGRVGLIVAMTSAFATFLRWAKLFERQYVSQKIENSQNGSKG